MPEKFAYWVRGGIYVLVIVAIFGFVYADNDDAYTNVKKLDRIAVIIKERYAEHVDFRDLIESGISGMLLSLDPYCRYFTDDDFRDFIDNTYGQFEGIGIEVDIRHRNLTVISVLEGTPAYRSGIAPGDKIIAVNGRLTSEMTREEAARSMRGAAGTPLELTIRRYGINELMNYSLIRETVETKSIPYSSVLEEGIGYIRLTRFTETTYYEMVEALATFKAQNVRGIILDLRSNPGGLLLEAVKVVGLFIEPNKLVVETRNREDNFTRHFSSNDGLSCYDIPLAVLVDEGTASAAEIVAGAIQDWDRGLIIGSRTYGKGLVQRIIRLDDVSALKLTTAKYYVPSGRCIQKPEDAGGLNVTTGLESFPVKNKKPGVYYTASGREVAGGGGITPDVVVESIKDTEIIKALKQQSEFFHFAFRYVNDFREQIGLGFVADGHTLREFKKYLYENDFDYDAQFEMKYDSLVAALPAYGVPGNLRDVIKRLDKQLHDLKFQRLEADAELVKWNLTEEIMVLRFDQQTRYGVVWVNHHPEILKAREILSTDREYREAFVASSE
ncbi:MAG: PDZ domain-containing protein [candidate division Zixibacteria bacterium]|nr:PDZ domain-containing protein [candidate division Zixibacteria bacterium]